MPRPRRRAAPAPAAPPPPPRARPHAYYVPHARGGADPADAHSALALLERLPHSAAGWLHVRVDADERERPREYVGAFGERAGREAMDGRAVARDARGGREGRDGRDARGARDGRDGREPMGARDSGGLLPRRRSLRASFRARRGERDERERHEKDDAGGGGLLDRLAPDPWALCWAELRAGFVLVARHGGGGGRWRDGGRYPKILQRSSSSTSLPDARAAPVQDDGEKMKPEFVFGVTNCLVHVRDARRGSAVYLRIVARHGAELVLRLANRAEADPWLWALSSTVSPYQSVSLEAFQVISPLGAGAFGKVYLVRDNRTNERLALKVLDKDMVFHDRLHFESAVNERLALELVCGLPFIARLRYACQTDRYLYLVTDFYEGGDLFNFLRNYHTHLMEAHAVRIIAQVVLALESLHALRLVYRDLKPENVLIDAQGNIRLADLGLAKLLQPETGFLTRTVCGSLAYASPSMLAGEPYGIALDQWCLGVFIYQVLTGDLPFATDDVPLDDILRAQLRGDIKKGSLSSDAFAIVCELLAPNPGDRPTCRELRSHGFFRSIDWAGLEAKQDHPHSLRRVMVRTDATFRATHKPSTKPARPHDPADDFLLRNFDPDEWSDMSFSDASDGVSSSSFFRDAFPPAARLAKCTRMLPGWNFNNRTGTWTPARYHKPNAEHGPAARPPHRARRKRADRWAPTVLSSRGSRKSL